MTRTVLHNCFIWWETLFSSIKWKLGRPRNRPAHSRHRVDLVIKGSCPRVPRLRLAPDLLCCSTASMLWKETVGDKLCSCSSALGTSRTPPLLPEMLQPTPLETPQEGWPHASSLARGPCLVHEKTRGPCSATLEAQANPNHRAGGLTPCPQSTQLSLTPSFPGATVSVSFPVWVRPPSLALSSYRGQFQISPVGPFGVPSLGLGSQ